MNKKLIFIPSVEIQDVTAITFVSVFGLRKLDNKYIYEDTTDRRKY